MKKTMIVILFIFAILLTSCGGSADPKSSDTTAPVISGTKAIYHEIGQATPNYSNGITAFDETDGNVTSSILVDSNQVNLGIEDTYEITYYAFDLSGNQAMQTVDVVVSSPDVVDLTPLDYPDREFVIKADMASTVLLGTEDASLNVMPPLLEIAYNEAAAQDLSWKTSYDIELAGQDYTRKTSIGFNILGSGQSIYIKLVTVSDELIIEKEVASTLLWREVNIAIPETQRHLLNERLKLSIIAPRPTESGMAGSVKLSGIWFEGDAEPAVKVVYDPELFETIYQVDLNNMVSEYDSFDDSGIAAGGLVTAVYDETNDLVTFTNTGFNDWASMAYVIPARYTDNELIPLNTVEYIIIEISVSTGAIVKAQSDWSSGDLFEYAEADDSTMQTWILPVGPNGYPAFAAVVLAPSYIEAGTDSSVVILHSIKLVKLIVEDES